MPSIFDEIIDRKNTGSEKWDSCDRIFGGENLLPLWVADMDFRAPKPVLDALAERAAHGVFGYTTYSDSTYEAVINWFMKRHGWSLKREWILYSPGVVPALNLLIQAFTSSGDGVIIQQPVYHPFMKLIQANGRTVLNNSLRQNSSGGYEIDFESLSELAARPDAQMMILCSPHNPVGRVWTESELKKIVEICAANNILIISDEIHCDLVFPGHRHMPLHAVAGGYAENIITCTAPSKTFNLAGLQASNIIIPDEKKRNIMKVWLLKNGMSECNSFASVAMEAAYNHCAEWLDDLLLYLSENYRLLKQVVSYRIYGASVSDLQGTYLAWVDFREFGLNDDKLAELFVKSARVAPSTGVTFGPEGSGFMRLNLACPRAVLDEGLARVADAFSELKT